MPRLSKEQSKLLATWVRQHHPDSVARVADAPDVTAIEAELGFAVRGDECIEWGGYRNPKGYGKITITLEPGSYTSLLAHRALREIVEGESTLKALHSCGNEACVNLNHTYYGTHRDNMDDAIRMSEMPSGASHPNGKLTDAQIMDIRTRYVKGNRWHPGNSGELAGEFGVSRDYINQIARGDKRASAQ